MALDCIPGPQITTFPLGQIDINYQSFYETSIKGKRKTKMSVDELMLTILQELETSNGSIPDSRQLWPESSLIIGPLKSLASRSVSIFPHTLCDS